MDFEEIFLSKEELSALRELKKSASEKTVVLVEAKNKTAFNRLAHFQFAEIDDYTKSLSGEVISFPLPKSVRITQRGSDYIAYFDNNKKDKRSDRRHDILLLLIGALITLFFDHFCDILNFARALFHLLGER